jgi:hypothetical protein
VKSKFKFWAYFLAFLAISFSLLLGSLVVSSNVFNPKTPIWFLILITLFFGFVWSWLVFGELRAKVISVEFDHGSFSVKQFLGLGASKTYYFDDIEGYKTSILPSNTGTYEYLYLMSSDKKVIKLSEYYHRNYTELKEYIINRGIKNLGFERFSYIKELKEIFS